MSRLVNTDFGIPQVSLTPTAGPIQTNVLPAPGQELRGNALQQIAESFSFFNANLSNFFSAMVAQDNRRSEEAGASIDFSEALARGDILNKNFQQIVKEMGLPDSSNPYFWIAAERNFGQGLYAMAENNVLVRRDELTDPSMSVDQRTQALLQAFNGEIERLGGDRLKNNFYANQTLNERMAKRFSVIQQDLDRTYLSRLESQAYLDFTTGIAEQWAGTAYGIKDEEFTERMQQFIGDLQRTSTDQSRFRSAFLDGVKLALTRAGTVQELDNIRAAVLDSPFGTASVMDNVALTLEVHEEFRRATKMLETKIDMEDRVLRQAVNAEENRLRADGWSSKVIDTAFARGDYMSVINEALETVEDPKIRSYQQDWLNRLGREAASQEQAARGFGSQEILLAGLSLVNSGELNDEVEILAYAGDRLNDRQVTALIRRAENLRAAEKTAQNQTQTYAQSIMNSLAPVANQMGVPYDTVREFGRYQRELDEALVPFLTGDETHKDLTYSDYRAKGVNALDIAVRGFLFDRVMAIRERELNGLQIAQQQMEISGPSINVVDAVVSFNEAVAPADKRKAVLKLGEQVYAANPIYESFGLNPIGTQRRIADPDRFAKTLVDVLKHPGVGLVEYSNRDPRSDPMGRGGPTSGGSFREIPDRPNQVRVKRDGDTFTIMRRNMFGVFTESGRFDVAQVAASALSLRMSPLGGLSVEQVIANESGVPGFTFEDAARRTSTDQRFRWAEVPVFSDMQELAEFAAANDAERNRILFRRTLGTENPTREQISDFFKAQRQSLMLRNDWREYRDRSTLLGN